MLREIRPAILILLLLTAITGVAYPLAMTAIAGAIFPKQAQGSLIEKDGKVIGSALIRDHGAGPGRFQQDDTCTL
jgi:potassium-transporting ATPase KdpC subunit